MTENSSTPAERDTPAGQGKHRGPAAAQDSTPAGGPSGRHRSDEDRTEQGHRAS